MSRTLFVSCRTSKDIPSTTGISATRSIGVTLAPRERERPKKNIRNAFELFGALFETMKDAHDARHIASRYEQNIIFLPVDDVMATDFHLTQQKKLALIELGKRRTELFLKQWTY